MTIEIFLINIAIKSVDGSCAADVSLTDEANLSPVNLKIFIASRGM
jgi:hypothetical protein